MWSPVSRLPKLESVMVKAGRYNVLCLQVDDGHNKNCSQMIDVLSAGIRIGTVRINIDIIW